eukprot:9435325-Pyramimonas_sp.AAC.1
MASEGVCRAKSGLRHGRRSTRDPHRPYVVLVQVFQLRGASDIPRRRPRRPPRSLQDGSKGPRGGLPKV